MNLNATQAPATECIWPKRPYSLAMLGWIGQPPHEENVTGAVGAIDKNKRMISHEWKRFGWLLIFLAPIISDCSLIGFGSFFI